MPIDTTLCLVNTVGQSAATHNLNLCIVPFGEKYTSYILTVCLAYSALLSHSLPISSGTFMIIIHGHFTIYKLYNHTYDLHCYTT